MISSQEPTSFAAAQQRALTERAWNDAVHAVDDLLSTIGDSSELRNPDRRRQLARNITTTIRQKIGR